MTDFYQRSKCCGAPISVANAPDFLGEEPTDQGKNYYICSKCDKPTDPQ